MTCSSRPGQRGARRARTGAGGSAARFPAPRPRWLYALIFAAAVGHLVYLGVRGPLPRAPHPRFAALASVDADLLERLRRLPWRKEFGRSDDEGPEAFRRIARAHGAEGARAILYLLIEKYPAGRSYTDMWGSAGEDAEREAPGVLLGELADDSVMKLMLRALSLRDFHPAFRRSLAVALCRERHREAALEPVLDRVLDRQEDDSFRSALLLRLHRFGGAPPRRLRELLYQPFEDLDVLAAATLARMGDPEAPSLVLAELERSYSRNMQLWHFAQAANRITGKTLPFEEQLSYEGSGDEAREEAERARVRPHRDALAAYLETAPKTEFERTRRARLTLKDFDDVLAAGNDFDLAEASMLVSGSAPESILFHLERLNHFGDFLRGKLRDAKDPEARIEVLNEWCLQRRRDVNDFTSTFGFDSFLPHVLGDDSGNCLGYSTLYVVLADRLDLPLFGVAAPAHCFVRYDDGRVRRNIETTAGGAEVPDEDYFTPEQRAAAPDALRRGVFLRNLDRRGMLSLVCSNYAACLVRLRRYEPAAEAARRALQLDSRNPGACVNHAFALFNLRLDNEPRVTEVLNDAVDLWPSVEVCLTAGQILLEYGHLSRARSYFARAHGLADAPGTCAWLAICRARQGEAGEALAMLQVAIAQAPDAEVVRVAELEARLRMDPECGRKLVPELAEGTRQTLAMHVAAARILVETGHPHLALEQLDRVEDLAKRSRQDVFLAPGFRELPDLESFVSNKRMYYIVRALAQHAAGNGEAARGALASAEETGPDDYFMLKARAALGDD